VVGWLRWRPLQARTERPVGRTSVVALIGLVGCALLAAQGYGALRAHRDHAGNGFDYN
jgi:hypothetical protein